jgi:multiple sugar transport system substrate-binding protein/sn-glycerol 3-phosphate transport system substrate-binding protein
MNKKALSGVLAVVLSAALLLSACAPAATPTQAPAAEPTATTAAAEPTVAPTEPAAEPTAAATEAEPTVEPTTAAPAATGTDYENVDPKGQEIVFWHNHTSSREETLAKMIEKFNSTNEWGIKVTEENQGSYSDIFNKMMPILNTPDVPGLVVAYQNQAATYQLSGALADMNSLVNSAKWGITAEEQNDIFPGFFAQDVFPNFGNARLGWPGYRSEEVLYFNQDWMKELGYDAAPTTPDQFKEMVCKASKTKFSKSTSDAAPTGYEFDPGDASHFAAWTFAMGGNIYDSKTGEFTYNSDAAVQAATFLQDLFKEGCVTLVTEQYGDQTDFGAGRVLFTTSSSSGLNYYAKAVDEGAKFQWSVGAIPHTTADPVMNIYGASLSIPKSTPEKELAAWLFLKYFTQPEVQAEWAQVSGYYPVRASVADSMTDFIAKNTQFKAGYDLLKYGIYEPPVPGYDFVRESLGKTLAQIVADPYPDVKPLMDSLNDEANATLKDQLSQMK